MNRIAVIAEYNPFHNGHHYMLRTLRSRFGSSAPIVVGARQIKSATSEVTAVGFSIPF